MNLFLGVLAVIVCTLIGYVVSTKYAEKRKFYNSFYNFNKSLKNEISFTQKSIIEISKALSDKDDFNRLLKNHFIDKKEFEFEKKYLSDNEIEFLKNYLTKIGIYDRNSEREFLENSDKILTDKLNLSTNDEKKYKNLYIKLGFLIGLIILVVLL